MRGFIICCLVLLAACGGGRNGSPAAGGGPVFRLPEVPALYSDGVARAGYLAAHYWDAVDFADTAWLQKVSDLEKALPDYLVALGATIQGQDGQARVRASYDRLLARASAQPALRDSLVGLLEKYLYDPNSPMLNEDVYIPALEIGRASCRERV